jgi:S-DNA-T family DNA segregation ATPase FtsK/SpoIIIE
VARRRLLYLFGASAWWWVVAGIVLVVAGYRRIGHPELETDHPFRSAVLGFGSCFSAASALEALALYNLPLHRCRKARVGALGVIIGPGLSRLVGFNGATLFLLALFSGRLLALFRLCRGSG